MTQPKNIKSIFRYVWARKKFAKVYSTIHNLIISRESVCKWWVAVQGLNHNEVRTISEKVGEQPEYNNDREKRVEWSVPTWTVLNGLEVMGYKVVTCGDYMTGEQRHDQKEFVWTLYKNKEEWENSTK